VTLVGLTNLPALLPTDASALYARNVLDFMKLIVDDEGRPAIAEDDEIGKACMVCKDGQVLRSAEWMPSIRHSSTSSSSCWPSTWASTWSGTSPRPCIPRSWR